MPKFYKLQMNNGAAGGERENIVEEMLRLNRITASLDYAPGFENLPAGQIVMVHRGSHPAALVRIIRPIEEEEPGVTSWGFNYEIESISRYDEACRAFPQLHNLPIGP